MGNTYCAGAREKLQEKKTATKELYSRVSDKVQRKYLKTKKTTKDNYQISKLRTLGYSLNFFEDNGETRVITNFEGSLSLCLVRHDQFDDYL